MGNIGFSYNLETELKSLFFLHLTKVSRFVVVQQNKQFNKQPAAIWNSNFGSKLKNFLILPVWLNDKPT